VLDFSKEVLMNRQKISSGTPWESKVGYSRAVRVGNMVFVSGTLAADDSGAIHGKDDAYAQSVYILRKIEKALAQAGATMRDVVRTRMFITSPDHQDAIGRAHAEFFKDVRPAATMIAGARFVSPDALVEIEVDAVVGGL
jgi:enamine deaminase RidA (YjgF/YER057c/UK114 family)